MKLTGGTKQMIHETVERTDLTHAQKAGALGENANDFYGFKKSQFKPFKQLKKSNPSNRKPASYISSFYVKVLNAWNGLNLFLNDRLPTQERSAT